MRCKSFVILAVALLVFVSIASISSGGDSLETLCFPPRITVTLISPLNNSNYSAREINFTCNAYSTSNITKIELYGSWNGWGKKGEWTGNQKNITYTFQNIPVDDGRWVWNCRAYSGNGSNFAPSNYTLFVDATPPDTNVTSIRNINLTSERRCEWNGTNFIAFVPYNQVVAYGVSTDNNSGVHVYIPPQYIWDFPSPRWLNSVVYNGRHGDPNVEWYQSEQNGTTLNEGNHRVCGRARDVLDNQENPGNGGPINVWLLPNDDCCDVCVDTRAPSAVPSINHRDEDICAQNNVSYDNDTRIRFEWESATDTGCAGVSEYIVWAYENGVLMNGYPVRTQNTYHEVNATGENKTYYIVVAAIDRAGNIGPNQTSIQVLTDWSGPRYDFIQVPTGWQTKDFNMTVKANDSISGLCQCIIKVKDEGTGKVYEENISCLCMQEITFNFTVTVGQKKMCETIGREKCKVWMYVKDKAGNSYYHKYKKFDIDYEVPTTTKEVGEPKVNNYITSNTPLTLDCNDGDGSGCNITYYRYYKQGSQAGEWENTTSWPFTFYIEGEDGTYIVEFYSIDKAGNEEPKKSQTHILDNTAPVTTKKLYGNYNDFVSSNTQIELSCSDEGVGCKITCYEIRNESGRFQRGCKVPPYNFTFNESLADGTYTLYFWSIDLLDNGEEMKNQTHYLDNTAPSIIIENPDSPVGCSALTFDVIAKVTDVGCGVKEVWARVVYSNNTPVPGFDWKQMVFLGNDRFYARFSNLIDAGNYTIEVKAKDNLENEGINTKLVGFYEDVYWEVAPSECEVNKNQGKECSFNYRITLCHGGDSIALAMHKLCCLTWLNPRINNGTTTVYVSELGQLNTFWYEGALLGQLSSIYFPGWCNNSVIPSWNYIKIASFNPTTRTGEITLNLTIPANITGSCEKMYYALKPGYNEGNIETIPRVSYFRISWPSGKIVLSPVGPTYAECGNGIIEPEDEDCDGLNLGGKSCEDFGYDGGILKCSRTCRYDFSSCIKRGPRGGGGGAGGGFGGEEVARETICKENWICTPWGPCVDGFRYRTCKDMNNCNTQLEKPSEKEACISEEAGKNQKVSETVGKRDKLTGAAIGISSEQLTGIFIILLAIGAGLLVGLILRKKKF